MQSEALHGALGRLLRDSRPDLEQIAVVPPPLSPRGTRSHPLHRSYARKRVCCDSLEYDSLEKHMCSDDHNSVLKS